MITKDRYSKAFLLVTIGLVLFVYFIRNGKGYMAAASGLIGILPLLYLATRPAKIHLSEDETKRLNPEFKGEGDCSFTSAEKTKIDGIRINGKRYKFVNGTDVCLSQQDLIIPCGFGSRIMQCIGGGGIEPYSIQNDKCWI